MHGELNVAKQELVINLKKINSYPEHQTPVGRSQLIQVGSLKGLSTRLDQFLYQAQMEFFTMCTGSVESSVSVSVMESCKMHQHPKGEIIQYL